jgi:hypothetical protein
VLREWTTTSSLPTGVAETGSIVNVPLDNSAKDAKNAPIPPPPPMVPLELGQIGVVVVEDGVLGE